MLKRVFLALTCAAALGAAGLGMTSKAEARHYDCDFGYGGYYGVYYPLYPVYYGYGPRFSYYRSYGHPWRSFHHHGHRHHHHHHGHHLDGRGGIHFSIGF
jgi:hypothetical protein